LNNHCSTLAGFKNSQATVSKAAVASRIKSCALINPSESAAIVLSAIPKSQAATPEYQIPLLIEAIAESLVLTFTLMTSIANLLESVNLEIEINQN
jgi:hypothetical protein